MKRFTIVVVLMAVAVWAVSDAFARTTAAGAFQNAPATVFPMLDRNARLDMIDYFNSGSSTPTHNQLNGRSRITAMDSDAVTIEMTDASVYRIVLLPRKQQTDTLFALIRTVVLPAHDSDMMFYDSQWRPLSNNKTFVAPVMADWLLPEADKELVAGTVPFMLAEYSYDVASSTLTVDNRLADFLSADDWKKVGPMLRQRIEYVWNPSKAAFKKKK